MYKVILARTMLKPPLLVHSHTSSSKFIHIDTSEYISYWLIFSLLPNCARFYKLMSALTISYNQKPVSTQGVDLYIH